MPDRDALHSAESRHEGVWHKDGALAQIRSMAEWAEGGTRDGGIDPETCRKIAANLRAALVPLTPEITARQWEDEADHMRREAKRLAAEIERLREVARTVVDAAPGYTAKRGSIWKLDHALDLLRDALDA